MRAVQRSMPAISEIVSAVSDKSLLMRALYFFSGLLVSRGAMFGDFVPFGVSFAAAVPYENVIEASIGSLLGYILLLKGASFRCAASVITVFALRWLFSDLPKINGSRAFAPLISSMPLLCTGFVMIIATSKGSSAVVMCVLEAMFAAVGAYFLNETVIVSSGRSGIRTFDQQEIACLFMTGCIFLLSVSSLTIGGISAGRIIAVTAVLFCAYYGSVAGGCVGGTAAGVVFGLSGEKYSFLTLSYAFGGLMSGLFSYAGRIGSAAAFLLCSAALSIKDGVTKESAAVFYETVIALLLFLFIPKETGVRIAEVFTPKRKNADTESLRRGVIMRLDLASRAIKGINEAVNSVARRLGEFYSNEINGVFSRSVDENCTRCGLRQFCMSEGEETHINSLAAVAPILEKTGSVDEDDLGKVFNKRCCKKSEMAESVNANYETYVGFLAAQARASQVRGVVAGQFSGLAEILSGLKDEFERYESFDEAAADRITAALRVKGFFALGCSVRTDTFGRLTVELELADENRRLLKSGDLSREISSLCGRRLSPPVISPAGNRVRVTLSERPMLDVQIGSAQHVCSDGRLCGDSFNYFRDGQGRFIVVISDGMGTGGRAAVDGSMAVSIISRLVKSGLGFDASLGAANAALMCKSDDESLATADILSLDLFSGEAEIMKAGAPVTFFRKSGKVCRIEPASLPAGILTDIRLTHDEMELSDGDLIVMVSDGAIALSDEWIGAMMRDFEGDDVQELVNDIIDEATIGSSFGRDDDITVIGIRVMDD